MKKYLTTILVMMMLLFGVANNVNAQTYYYRTYQFAIKYKTDYGWTSWSEWQSSNMKMKIDLDDDIIVIYSEKRQIYNVIENSGTYTDESGGQQTKFFIIDQDNDYGYIRLRIERNGNSQIYIDFADVMWVYNVRRVYD